MDGVQLSVIIFRQKYIRAKKKKKKLFCIFVFGYMNYILYNSSHTFELSSCIVKSKKNKRKQKKKAILMDIPNRFFLNTNTSFKLIWLNIQTYVFFCILFFFSLIICIIRNQAWSSIFVPIFWGIGEIKFNDLMYLKCKSSFVFSFLNSNITFISKS